MYFYNARWYDPYLGRFAQADTQIPLQQGAQAWDRYAYVNNNPLNYVDASGHFIESPWDAFNVGVGLVSLAYNLSQGNYGDAVIDAVGVAIDAAATITPGVPGGASSLIKLYRAGDAALEIAEVAVKHGDEIIEGASAVSQVMKNADEVVGAFCSFSADTLVATQDGDKPISELEVGEEVLAWNEETNEVGYYEVIDTFSHVDPVLTELIISGEWIETTPEHPFYTLEEGWLPADELKSGMHVRQADGDYELVWFKWNIEKNQEMYNFTVDTAHTYFVGEGQWLVHNECPLVFGPSANGKLRELADEVGGVTLNDLDKPMDQTWIEFSINTLNNAADTNRKIIFDTRYMEDIDDVIAGVGKWADTITGQELRYINSNWNKFKSVVVFME